MPARIQPTLARVSAALALGYVEKPRLAVDLLHAVREACAGRPCFSC